MLRTLDLVRLNKAVILQSAWLGRQERRNGRKGQGFSSPVAVHAPVEHLGGKADCTVFCSSGIILRKPSPSLCFVVYLSDSVFPHHRWRLWSQPGGLEAVSLWESHTALQCSAMSIENEGDERSPPEGRRLSWWAGAGPAGSKGCDCTTCMEKLLRGRS